jgi:D-beta-D-heptose 7-phosphate kinase/D-beta-D-heptose 1-phosphate adenosyltransferase
LVVGLNTDASVRGLKGEGRPIQNENARAAVLASMGAVDMVIPFVEETPMRLIEAIRPDALVKGADYTVDQVVGGAFVESYGGRIVLAELAPGESSSGLVSRIGELKRQAGE